MMERSMMQPDGRITGSLIRVSIRGSITQAQAERGLIPQLYLTDHQTETAARLLQL